MRRGIASGMVLMLLLTCLLSLLLHSRLAAAQLREPPIIVWSKTYGGTGDEIAHSVIQTADGGFLLVGYTSSYGAGDRDVWLFKTDSAGNMLWNRTYGGPYAEDAYQVLQTRDGGYALIGWTSPSSANDMDVFLVKTDADGYMQWNRTYGGASYDVPTALFEMSDEGFVILAYTLSFGEGDYDVWVLRTDSTGNVVWNRTYGGEGREIGNWLIQASDDEYIVAGATSSFGTGGYDGWLFSIDADGDVLKSRTYGLTEDEGFMYFVRTSDDGYAIVGWNGTYPSGPSYAWDAWLLKIDQDWELTWDRTYGTADAETAYGLHQMSDEGYLLLGYTNHSTAGDIDGWLFRTDLEGNVLWSQTYGGVGLDSFSDMIRMAEGEYVLSGRTLSFGAGGGDAWLIKLAEQVKPATVAIEPSTLALASKSRWITAHIELPEGYDVGHIDVSSISLNDTVPAEPSPVEIGDYDSDGVPDLMVKFDWSAVQRYITDSLNENGHFTEVLLTVTGLLKDGTRFHGSQTVRIITPAMYWRAVYLEKINAE